MSDQPQNPQIGPKTLERMLAGWLLVILPDGIGGTGCIATLEDHQSAEMIEDHGEDPYLAMQALERKLSE